MLSFTQVITNAIAFAITARFSTCRWTVQNWAVLLQVFLLPDGSIERKATVKTGMQYRKATTDARF